MCPFLGYLNFSAGAFDASAWKSLNDLYLQFEPSTTNGEIVEQVDTVNKVAEALRVALDQLHQTNAAFRDVSQAEGVLRIVFDNVLPAYRAFHSDLLEHQATGAIERPFFLMAVFQAVLEIGGPWAGQDDVLVKKTLRTINDYMGWRPVAVLENDQLSEPYPHERIRPIPIYRKGVGAAHGRFTGLVNQAIHILNEAPKDLLQQADFDLNLLTELSVDPRAFDFCIQRPVARIIFSAFGTRCVLTKVATIDALLFSRQHSKEFCHGQLNPILASQLKNFSRSLRLFWQVSC